MERNKLLATVLGLLLIVSLCLHLVMWLQIKGMEDEIRNLRNRPTIVFPGGSMRARPE